MPDELLSDIPFETLPLLASHPDFARLAERARYLKQLNDECFTDKKDERGMPVAEFPKLRIELGALVAVAGVKSVVYQDLRITNTEPSATGTPGSGSIEPSRFSLLLGEEAVEHPDDSDQILLLAIIAAARSFDEDALMEAGVPPHLIARSRGIGKGRAGSTRIEWVGRKGRGAGKKQGTGGPVQ